MNMVPSAAVEQHIAIVGKTGSGKTYAAKSIVEGLIRDGRQVCVIDPTAAWWGLRSAADGGPSGLSIVLLGGDHADIPLAPGSGAAVARLVTAQRASVVVDTSGFTVGEYTRWFIDFAGELFATIRAPLHLVIDEAHHFMPQARVPDVQAGRMLHAGNRLMSGGRSRGIRGMLITQRPAKLHKDALTCADTLIAMRVIAPQDRDAIKAWVDGCGDPKDGRRVMDSLAQLRRGEGWVWFPEGGHLQRGAFPPITTWDSSAAPKHGAKAPAARLTEVKLDEVKAAMEEAVKEAEANDPKRLRQEIATLKAELDRLSAQPEAGRSLELVEMVGELGTTRGLLEGLHRSMVSRMLDLQSRVGDALSHLKYLGESHIPDSQPQEAAASPSITSVMTPAPAPAPSRRAPTGGSGRVGGGLRRMLIALAQRPQGLSDRQIGVRAGLSSRSGTFSTYLGRARSEGWIEGGKDCMRITAAGLRHLGAFEPLPTGRALLEHWLTELGNGGASRMLRALADRFPRTMTKDQLGAAAGISSASGTFSTYLGRLRALELVTGTGDELRATEEFSGGARA